MGQIWQNHVTSVVTSYRVHWTINNLLTIACVIKLSPWRPCRFLWPDGCWTRSVVPAVCHSLHCTHLADHLSKLSQQKLIHVLPQCTVFLPFPELWLSDWTLTGGFSSGTSLNYLIGRGGVTLIMHCSTKYCIYPMTTVSVKYSSAPLAILFGNIRNRHGFPRIINRKNILSYFRGVKPEPKWWYETTCQLELVQLI